MDHESSALDAATSQHVQNTLDMLRTLAREFAGQDHNLAAPNLAAKLYATADADLLAQTLANVLLDQVRRADDEAAFTDESAQRHVHTIPVDGDFPGVEIRLIGPERSCEATMNRMDAAGIPLLGGRGPMRAADREGTVRFYAYTDAETAKTSRGRRRGGAQDRPSRRQKDR